jgi:hypothetical protein
MAFQQIAAYMAAILFASLSAAALAAGMGGLVKLMPLVLGVAVAHATLLGLPLFLFLRRKGWANALSSLRALGSSSVPFRWALSPGLDHRRVAAHLSTEYPPLSMARPLWQGGYITGSCRCFSA